ncbi:unnamed protein product [Heligmosomoides polygyrus]|uniref:DUF4706 domain-containing protein n=1 Tax=Heligmosomoides polygyrus TaxID=6339 RepID=A0A183F8Q3_HELPZ|nr:unnamed protein product [Heligmosomoides polygyrus]
MWTSEENKVYQDQVNRKVLLEWVRITGLAVPQKANYDAILLDFAQKILEYPSDRPNPFSWPVQAGYTNTGPAIRSGRRRLYEYNKKNDTDIRIIREKTKPVMDQEKLGLFIRKTLREAYHAAKIKGEEVNLIKGKIVIGKEQPMRPTTAAVKLNLNMTAWQGEPLESMLCKQEKEDIEKGALVYGSLKLKGIDVSVGESSSTEKGTGDPTTSNVDDSGPSQPKRKRTLADFITVDLENRNK